MLETVYKYTVFASDYNYVQLNIFYHAKYDTLLSLTVLITHLKINALLAKC